MTALLEVRDLRVGYGAIPVLQGIDFDVEEGKTTVLLGLNGAGKTTTVASIAGQLRPTRGSMPRAGVQPARIIGGGRLQYDSRYAGPSAI